MALMTKNTLEKFNLLKISFLKRKLKFVLRSIICCYPSLAIWSSLSSIQSFNAGLLAATFPNLGLVRFISDNPALQMKMVNRYYFY